MVKQATKIGKNEENNGSEEDYKKRRRNRKLEKGNDDDRSRKGEVSARNKEEKGVTKVKRGEGKKEMKKRMKRKRC